MSLRLPAQFGFVKYLSLIGALAVLGSVAHATTITYDLSGVTTAAGSLSGTVSINSTTDLITSADITFDDAGFGVFTFTDVTSEAAYNGLGQAWITGDDPTPGSSGQIALFYDTAAIGSGDLDVCLGSGPYCGTNASNGDKDSEISIYWPSGFNDNVTGGVLDAARPTIAPEPSSLVLLGTGLFGLAMLVARFDRSRA